MFFLLNKCFIILKHQIIFTNTHAIAFASNRVANAKKGARTSLSPRSPHLFSSSYSLLLSSASTDADARNDRRRHPHRPTRMTFVDVSQCQTFTFVLPTVAFAVQDLPFHISLPLFLSISSSVYLNQRCFSVVCILGLQPLKQSLSPIII